MAKELQWKEYSAITEDEDGDEHTSTIRAAIIDKETARNDVPTRVGSHNTRVGDVVIEIPGRSDMYDVLSKSQWEGTGYANSSSSDNSDGDDNDENETPRKTVAKKAAAKRATARYQRR